jgi:hypothetical protein
MNYDTLEREVLDYGRQMSRRSEHRRVLGSVAPGQRTFAARPTRAVRAQLAVALRTFADHLDTSSAQVS